MSKFQLNVRNWGIVLLAIFSLILVGYLAFSSLLAGKLSSLEASIRTQIADQTTVLVAIAEATARNGGDQVTESIVPDCPAAERVQFDSLLNQLNDGLSRAQLIELDRLFGRCGDTFAKRKAIMSARLTREVEVHLGLVDLLSKVTQEEQNEEYFLASWVELTELEHTQSSNFSQLVTLQDRIISTLLDGKLTTSPEIIEILDEVKEVRGELLLANLKAKEIRSILVPL